MAVQKHDWKVVYNKKGTGEIREFVYKNISSRQFQVRLGQLVNGKIIPKGILWPGGEGILYKDGEEVGFNEKRISMIKDYRDSGYTIEEIADTLKAPTSAVRAVLKNC